MAASVELRAENAFSGQCSLAESQRSVEADVKLLTENVPSGQCSLSDSQ